ncbi:resistance-like protein, partial [Trifolium medium]|nr:resistance-like protein [Trifolium medium]
NLCRRRVLVGTTDTSCVFESYFGLGVGRRVWLGMVLMWHAVVWSIWTSRNDIIFTGGSSTIDNLVDRVKLSSWK